MTRFSSHVRRLPPLRRRVAVTAALVAISASAAVVHAVPAAAAPLPPRCHTADLSGSVVADTSTRMHGGGMNHQGATIALKNVSGHACRVYGYPGAAMVDSAGREAPPATVTWGRTYYALDPGPHRVVLAAGAKAYFDLSWSSATGYRPTVTTRAVIVTPPDERTFLTVPLVTTFGGNGELEGTALSATPPTFVG